MLKMTKGFFNDTRIKAIKKYLQGDRYVMIFTMLVGISEPNAPYYSLVSEQGGALTDNELAKLCGVKRELFDKAMLLLDANGLIERDNGVTYVNTNGLFEQCLQKKA